MNLSYLMDLAIGLALGALVSAVLFFIFKNKFAKQAGDDQEAMLAMLELRMKSLLPEIMSKSQEDLLKLANEKLGSEKKEIKTDLENKRSEIERMIKMIQQELKSSQETLTRSEKDRVGSYKALLEKLEQQQAITKDLQVTTESLKNVLSNNQMRGQFGEQVAEELLKMAGFVKGMHYDYNKSQESRDTRPDFTVYLPDKTKINIDVKFPYSNLQKATEAKSEEEKRAFMKAFEQDVKKKIKDVKGREYINPSDNTVDFAIIFIPNEMIFSYIYDKLNSVWADAMNSKIIFAGPFSFTAILRMVWQAYENFRFQSNIREIVANVKEVDLEFTKFFESFSKIGDRIKSLDKQFTEVEGTRARAIKKRLEKVKIEDLKEPEEQPKLMDDME